MTTENRIKVLEDQLKIERQNQQIERASKVFNCSCGSQHRIKDCIAIQTYWYTSPSGCFEGDYWNEGELQIVCPDTNNKNRLLYNSKYNIKDEDRNEYKYSAEQQFNSMYKKLFKEVVHDYDKDARKFWNNYEIDRNHEYYGIKIGESK